MIPFIVTGCVILSAGFYMVKKGRKNLKSLKEYEQENQASDGTVKFDNIQQSRSHGANKNLFRMILVMGCFTGLFGLILMGYGFNLFQHP